MQGIAVDIERGLRQKHFPIRVRYILTSDTYAPKTVESEDWVEGKDWIYIYIYMLAPPPKPTFSHCDEGDRATETCACNFTC